VVALVVHDGGETETTVRVLYLNVRELRLCFRFQLNTSIQPLVDRMEVTFVSENGSPLLVAPATRSIDNEYWIDLGMPEELARDWESLKVTDRMPFRLILRPS
jgi:hypothetical protein